MKKVIAILTVLSILICMPAEVSAASYIKTSATSTQSSVTLKWKKLSKKQQKKIGGIAIFRNGNVVKRLKKTATSFTDAGLKENTAYTYQVKSFKVKKVKQWYNKKTKKWQKKKPAKKYRGKSKKRAVYTYANISSKRSVKTKASPKKTEPTITQPITNVETVQPSFPTQGEYLKLNCYEAEKWSVSTRWSYRGPSDVKFKLYRDGDFMGEFDHKDFKDISDDGSVLTYWPAVRDSVGYSTTYTYRVDVIRNGEIYKSDTTTLTSSAAPAPVTHESGHFVDTSAMYTYINQWRQDPNNQWYSNKDGSKTIVNGSDLVILVRDEKLEKIAQQRAMEQWIVRYEQGDNTGHIRPDKQGWDRTVAEMGMNPIAENLIQGLAPLNQYTAIFDSVYGWDESGYNYLLQGHRRTMLLTKPTVKKVGFGSFVCNNHEVIAMELAY